MYYYQHHIGDFIKATARLSDSQAMAYLRMLWAYYDEEKPFVNDIDEIAFKVGADRDVVERIVKNFFEVDGDVIRHSRCDEEIAGYKAKALGGAKGAAKRWGSKDSYSLPNSIPIANPSLSQCPSHAEGNSNQEPITDNHKPITEIQKPKGENKTAVAPLVLPQWLEAADWQRYVDYRKKSSGKKFTAEAEKLNLSSLADLVRDGQDPILVINQSIAKGWAGLFAVKDQGSFRQSGRSSRTVNMQDTLSDLQLWAAEGSSNG